MSVRYTIYRLDVNDGITKIIKQNIETREDAARKTASFKRLAKNLNNDDWRYFYKSDELHA